MHSVREGERQGLAGSRAEGISTYLRASPRAVHMPRSWCRKVSAFSVATLMSPISLQCVDQVIRSDHKIQQ